MTSRKTEEQNERRERRQNALPASNCMGKSDTKKRKPRGALFHGEDPTLAKRAEEELNTLGR